MSFNFAWPVMAGTLLAATEAVPFESLAEKSVLGAILGFTIWQVMVKVSASLEKQAEVLDKLAINVGENTTTLRVLENTIRDKK